MTALSANTHIYRWVVLFCAFLTLCVSNGMTLAGPTVFDEEILNALAEITGDEIPLGAFKLTGLIMFLTAGGLGFFAGALADRIGIKPLMLTGLAMLAAGNFFYGRVQSLTDLYWIYAGFGLLLTLCGLMLNVMLVSRWFVRGRGLAIGLLLAGSSVGNGFFPPLNAWLLGYIGGWREVFDWIALIPLALIPVLFLLVRERPTGGDGEDRSATSEEAKAQRSGYTLMEALTSLNFWILAVIAMCTFYAILAMSLHAFLYLRTEGYAPQIAATGATILFVGGMIGKIISGYFAETFGRKRVLFIGLILMLTGSGTPVTAITLGSAEALWLGLVLFGFGWGGIYTLLQLLAADLFGLLALGKILGVINIVDTVGGALGPWLTGVLFELQKSYVIPFAVITGLLVIAMIAATFLRPEQGAYPSVAPELA
jgi:MFS family permease